MVQVNRQGPVQTDSKANASQASRHIHRKLYIKHTQRATVSPLPRAGEDWHSLQVFKPAHGALFPTQLPPLACLLLHESALPERVCAPCRIRTERRSDLWLYMLARGGRVSSKWISARPLGLQGLLCLLL